MTDAESQSSKTARQRLRDLPPSAKLVAKTLEYEGKQTQGELAESTMLSNRTVRDALDRLERAGLTDSKISFMDARKRIYWLIATL